MKTTPRDEAAAYLASLGRFGWHLGLERISGLLVALGHPERAYPCVQVAGTNGKGSTCVTLAHLLAAAGYRTGLYTSPHLESYRERLAVLEGRQPGGDGFGEGFGIHRRLISARRFQSVLRRVAEAAQEVGRSPAGPPTEFEVLTAAAVQWFAEEGVEIAVLETGLGGRLDATTAVPAVLSVITHIDLDHTDRLGTTLEAIAAEKAAIIRRGQPVVVAPQAEEAWGVIRRRAAEQAAPVLTVAEEGAAGSGTGSARFAVEEVTWRHTAFRYFPPGEEDAFRFYTTLLGRHQAVNAAVALGAAGALAGEGFHVPEHAARRGLAAVRWPARLEVVRRRPLVVVDGAHNPDGMRRLAEAWRELRPAAGRPVAACGFLRDKAVAELVGILSGLVGEAIITRPASERAADPGPVAKLFREQGIQAQVVEDPVEAARLALARAGAAPGTPVLGCGSLYLAGILRRTWRERSPQRQ